MKKFINGLRYGSTKTKLFLICLALLIVFGFVSLVVGIAYQSPLWDMSAVFSFVLVLVFSQSLTVKKMNSNHVKKLQAEPETPKETLEENAYIQSITEEQIKKICVKYKVKKERKPIMIDSWDSKKVQQCPAFVWTHRGYLMVLLFEKEPRRIEIPLCEAAPITYERGCRVSVSSDYRGFDRPSAMSLAFAGCLPTTYEETLGMHRYMKKNLYVIGKGLKVTNTSARTMMDLLSLPLDVKNNIKREELKNVYYETAYACHLMLKDGVLSVNEFKTKIKLLLQRLAEAKIDTASFAEYMNQLVEHRLITREYANYYMDSRSKKKGE